jgi:hypothetical protein
MIVETFVDLRRDRCTIRRWPDELLEVGLLSEVQRNIAEILDLLCSGNHEMAPRVVKGIPYSTATASRVLTAEERFHPRMAKQGFCALPGEEQPQNRDVNSRRQKEGLSARANALQLPLIEVLADRDSAFDPTDRTERAKRESDRSGAFRYERETETVKILRPLDVSP